MHLQDGHVGFVSQFVPKVLLCSSDCPGTHYVDQADLKLRNPRASASQVLELKARATMTQLPVVSVDSR